MREQMIKNYYLAIDDNVLPQIESEYNGYVSQYVAYIRISGLNTANKLFSPKNSQKNKRKEIYDAIEKLVGPEKMTDRQYITEIECACSALRLYIDKSGVSNNEK